MYRHHLSMIPTNQSQSLPLPPLLVNPFTVLMQANPIPWCEGLYYLPFSAGSAVYQPYGGPYHWQVPTMAQQRAPSSGPSRTWANQQRQGFRKAETPYLNNERKSSGTVKDDRSTGINPGMARIGTNNDRGCDVGKVWRSPSKDPTDD